MTKFKDLFLEKAFHKKLEDPSVSVSLKGSPLELSLRFDSKDRIIGAGYSGNPNPWMSSLCFLLIGKSLHEAQKFTWKTWEEVFRNDQTFWDFKQEFDSEFLHYPLELLHACLDVFRGRDDLYHEESDLICRCFGIRESDILAHLQKNEMPTLESLSGETKAGMGCRSCVPQLKRWVAFHDPKKLKHHYKEKAVSEWLLEIDYMLSCFPESKEWKMELQGMKNEVVQISFDKEVSQKEEEEVSKRLQDFLGASVDGDLAFFLRRARHFSKARG